MKKLHKSDHELENENIITELQKLEGTEYGLKEFIHGLLIGVIVGFLIALMLLR